MRGLPAGLQAGASGSTEISEEQLSLPDVVGLLKEFLEVVSSKRRVLIGIDELDKMDDETARRFLNEIKVVFRVPRCFFLVSISEDAMSSFERRGLPFRDVFDSSFDDVLHVPNLELSSSRALLDRRVVDLAPLKPFTEPFALCKRIRPRQRRPRAPQRWSWTSWRRFATSSKLPRLASTSSIASPSHPACRSWLPNATTST